MSNIYYHSDWHLNHDFVARTRGFESVEAHDEWLIDNINSVIRPRDQLWVLGDLTMSSLGNALEKIKRINGVKHLVLGNHDSGHPMHSRSHSQVRRYYEVFSSVAIHEQHEFSGHRVMLSHFPYSGDHKEEDRHMEWRLPDTGRYLIHGHVHAEWATRGRQYNVGVDHHPAPVSRQEVGAWINSQGEMEILA